MNYAHIIAEAVAQPWAILPEKLAVISHFLSVKAAGGEISAEEIAAMKAAVQQRANPRAAGAVAVLPMVGTIFPRANMMTDMSGGVSLDRWMGMFRSAVADAGIKAIVIDCDSPGGYTAGVEEAATEIRAARDTKPIVAVSNAMMASAAYYLASGAGEIVASPSSLTGSIGCYMMHVDQSGMNEQMGVKPTYISAGKYKVEGNADAPLSEDAKAMMQDIVDQRYADFVGAVAKGRGVSPDAVRNGFGQGRVLTARDALKAGMVDRIGTLGETIQRYAGGGQVSGMRAEDLQPEVLAAAESQSEPETTEPVAAPLRAAAQRELALERFRQ